MLKLFPLNTNVLQVIGLKDQLTGLFINADIVTARVTDSSGSTVGGPITLAYIASSNGNYQGILPATFNAPVCGPGLFFVVIDADDGTGIHLHMEVPAAVERRTQ